ncbi:hypothetical protein NQ317_007261 [Molorchus minor]|uniref:Lipase n=1 Tax=Molorchus minor TaxID=1323400 RepID=A0ABQ9JIA1_9CUCU|nr:hypothetical protein NQ317_007261 [Molorchus minor]
MVTGDPIKRGAPGCSLHCVLGSPPLPIPATARFQTSDGLHVKDHTEIIQSWEVVAEEHYITTDDGYILLLERAYIKTGGTPILIVHGIAMNSLGFIYRGQNSLVYLLVSLGYDVWILNWRGTIYSRGHVKLSTTDRAYWYYSVHELAIYDARNSIRYIKERVNQKIIYIGYSTGTTMFYIYSSVLPNEAKEHIQGMIGLGPAINFKGAKSVLQISAYVWPIARPLIYALFHGEIIPHYTQLVKVFMHNSFGMYFTQTLINLAGGFDYQQMDAISYPFTPRWLDTAGVEVWTHFLQIRDSGVFQHYDHGPLKNTLLYGQPHPPPYNISKISVPIALFVGPNDWIASVTNADQLYSELTESSRCGYHLMDRSKWSHYDFVMAKDIKSYLYDHLINKIAQIASGNCNP